MISVGMSVALCQGVEVVMKWLVLLAVLGSVVVSTEAEAQSLFPDRRAEIELLRNEMAMTQEAQLDFRRDQTVPNRLIRVGAPMLALGVGALAVDMGMLMASMSGQTLSREGFIGLAAGGMAFVVGGLVSMLVGRHMRRRSERNFLARQLHLRDELRHSRRALRGGY